MVLRRFEIILFLHFLRGKESFDPLLDNALLVCGDSGELVSVAGLSFPPLAGDQCFASRRLKVCSLK